MIEAMTSAFGNDADVKIVEHDFDQKLPRLGPFDERNSLYQEIFEIIGSVALSVIWSTWHRQRGASTRNSWKPSAGRTKIPCA